MPAQTAKSPLAGVATEARKAHTEIKDNKAAMGDNQRLPAGISNGVAQLQSAKFDVYKEGKHVGKPYFMAVGIVKEPKLHNGIKLEGRRTTFGPEPICPTPEKLGDNARRTVKDHLDHVYKFLRAFEIDTSDPAFFDHLEPTVNSLAEAAPHFEFETRKGREQKIEAKDGKYYVGSKAYGSEEAAKKANPYVGQEPMIFEQWGRMCEYNGEDTGGVGAVEDSGATTAEADTGEQPGGEPAAEQTFEELVQSLAEAADVNTDEEAQEKLSALAKERDIDDTSLGTWAEVAEAILVSRNTVFAREAGGGEAEEPEPEPEPEPKYVPNKKDILKFKPDPKRAKLVDVQVVSVDAKSETCVLLNLTDKKTQYKGVGYDRLIQP